MPCRHACQAQLRSKASKSARVVIEVMGMTFMSRASAPLASRLPVMPERQLGTNHAHSLQVDKAPILCFVMSEIVWQRGVS